MHVVTFNPFPSFVRKREGRTGNRKMGTIDSHGKKRQDIVIVSTFLPLLQPPFISSIRERNPPPFFFLFFYRLPCLAKFHLWLFFPSCGQHLRLSSLHPLSVWKHKRPSSIDSYFFLGLGLRPRLFFFFLMHPFTPDSVNSRVWEMGCEVVQRACGFNEWVERQQQCWSF